MSRNTPASGIAEKLPAHEAKPARRGILFGGAAALGGLAGTAFGYERHDQLLILSKSLRGVPLEPAANAEFITNAGRISEAQRRQTLESVRLLKAKYEAPVFGKVRVWDMIQKLGMCIDETDTLLMLTSQYIHVRQILEGMERDGVQDRDLFLIALLHDLGKVLMTEGAPPDEMVGFTAPLGEVPDGVGLDHVVMQFGHDEIVYSRMKDHVPEHIAWTLRYHSASSHHSRTVSGLERYYNDRDRQYAQQYLDKFRPFDLGMKSYNHVPRVDMRPYRDLIEQTFPHPILF